LFFFLPARWQIANCGLAFLNVNAIVAGRRRITLMGGGGEGEERESQG